MAMGFAGKRRVAARSGLLGSPSATTVWIATLLVSTLLAGCSSPRQHSSPHRPPRSSAALRWPSSGLSFDAPKQESVGAQEAPTPGQFGPTEDPDRWRESAEDDAYHEDTDLHPTISGFWLPAVRIRPDKDERESNDGLEFDADLATDPGFGVQISLEGGGEADKGVGSVGLLYLNSRHSERDVGTHAHVHQLVVEARGRRFLASGPIRPHFGFGVGLGGMILDFDDRFDDTGGLTGTLRGEVGVRAFDHFEVTAGLIGFVWGYPGEWVGYGGSLIFGGVIRF